MDRAEIVSILRIIRTGHFGQAREAIEAAIAELEPQPVTEDALREAGFENELSETFFLYLSDRLYPCITYRNGWFCLHVARGVKDLHITDMQTLHAVIAALRGKP